jgi:hypothetical protein
MLTATTCLFASIAPTEAIVVRHDRDLQKTLELGERFPFVCAAGGGTGALIGPRWVLTAAHVVESFGPFDFRVRFGDREVAVARTFIHPGEEELPWDRRSHDIALLLLKDAVENIAPVALFRGDGELGEMEELGKTAVIAGVGFFATAGGDFLGRDGRRRAVTNRVVDLEDDWLRTVFSRPPGGTELEGMGAPGDSGGPLMIEAGGAVLLAGVGSYSEYLEAEGGQETGYGTVDFYARVSSYVPWIEETKAAVEAGRPGSDEGPSPPGGVRSAASGLPDTPVGTRAATFFEAFNSGDTEAFHQFLLRDRTAESLAGKSMDEHLAEYRERYRAWGRLELLRFVATDPDTLSVLARSGIGEMVFDFRVAPNPPQRLTSIRISY